jgi:hypothetical protein
MHTTASTAATSHRSSYKISISYLMAISCPKILGAPLTLSDSNLQRPCNSAEEPPPQQPQAIFQKL